MPSPPSRMPSVEDPSSLGISIRTGLPYSLAVKDRDIEGSGIRRNGVHMLGGQKGMRTMGSGLYA